MAPPITQMIAAAAANGARKLAISLFLSMLAKKKTTAATIATIKSFAQVAVFGRTGLLLCSFVMPPILRGHSCF